MGRDTWPSSVRGNSVALNNEDRKEKMWVEPPWPIHTVSWYFRAPLHLLTGLCYNPGLRRVWFQELRVIRNRFESCHQVSHWVLPRWGLWVRGNVEWMVEEAEAEFQLLPWDPMEHQGLCFFLLTCFFWVVPSGRKACRDQVKVLLQLRRSCWSVQCKQKPLVAMKMHLSDFP